MTGVSERIAALKPSAPFQIAQRAAELREQGRDVVALGAGEPDFETPGSAAAAAIAAIEAGHTHYTPVAGIPSLREAIAAKFARDQDLHYDLDEILVSTGAKQSLFNALLALTDPGQTVLIPAPYWVSYPAMAQILGLETRILPAGPEDGFKLQPAALREALDAGAKVLLLNSPSNPSGAVYSREELEALGRELLDSPTWIITDEIYEKLVFDGLEHHSLATVCPQLRDRIVVVNGVSKAYAMTGWRIGYAAAPLDVAKAMVRVQSHTTSNPSSISQHAALAALSGGEGEVEAMRRAFEGRRSLLVEALRGLPGVRLDPPGGAFYVFPDVSAWFHEGAEGSTALCRKILEEQNLALVPGEAFGDDRCIRISYAASDEVLRTAVDRLDRFVRGRDLPTSS